MKIKRLKYLPSFLVGFLMLFVTVNGQNDGIYMQPSDSVILSSGQYLYFMDQNNKVLPIFQYDGLTYVPLRAFAEHFGKEVIWYEKTETIEIQDPPQQEYEGVYYGQPGEATEVSMIQLIAHPEKYDGKKVSIKGILNTGFEVDKLFLTREDRVYFNVANSVGLTFRSNNLLNVSIEEIEKLNSKFVEVVGIYRASDNDTGYLANIESLYCCESYYAN